MLPLEPTDDLASPAFKDTDSCTRWLSQFQLTNLSLAHGTLRAQLDEFSRFPLRGKDRLETLEALRETVNIVQDDFSKRLFGKRLPFADEDFTTLVALTSLWQSMLNGYLRCMQSWDAGDTTLASDVALISHRCLLYSGLQLGEFLRAGCEPDGQSWQRFHMIYAYIEERGFQQTLVADRFNRTGRPVSCLMLYVKTLLLHRARLLGLSRVQWHIVDRWLEYWGDTFTIEPNCSMTREDAPPLAVDLAGARGLVAIHRATNAAGMRFLAMVPLSKLIRVKTILLLQGQTPQQNELGDELNSNDCIELLNRLHACWCEQRAESLADEPRDAPVAELCFGLENIYAHISRKPFKAPNITGIADKEVQRQIETFGRVLDQTDRHNLLEVGFLSETWLMEDDGLLQGRLLRKLNTGERLGMNQILCVHNTETKAYKVGVVSLVSVARSGQLYIGVRYLPGSPQSMIVRGNSCGNLLTGAAAALMLPEIPRLRIPASIVLPRDWFQAGRRVDLALKDNPKLSVILGFSVDKGNDYERVSFTPAS
ncbi:hypothetical protein GALL_165450 [mine drainage metagenome]|uniref:Uncharacterized protein n=1 Tax=mine drainage metagenome TaxID=410659 RepID=A0A1J5SN14_9ZZZZ